MTMDELYNLADEFDMLLGERLRSRRLMLGVSQEELGRAVDLSIEQVSKYEGGVAVMPSSILYVFARRLNAPISYFLGYTDIRTNSVRNVFSEDVEEYIVPNSEYIPPNSEYIAEQYSEASKGKLHNADIKSLMNVLKDIRNPNVRRKILELVEELCDPCYLSST